MKRMKRLLAVCVIFAVCLSFGGCLQLDEMREKQAFFQPDGNILWKDTVYKRLPSCEELRFTYDYSYGLYATDPDVPVLLSSAVGQWMNVYSDGVLLEGGYDGHGYVQKYCREDKYQDILKRIVEGFRREVLCYVYMCRTDDGGYVDVYYDLTQPEQSAIEQVLEAVTPINPEENGLMLVYDESVELLEASRDHLFSRSLCYVVRASEAYYIRTKGIEEDLLYRVPAELEETIGHVLRANEGK